MFQESLAMSKNKNKGIVSVVILFAAAVLAVFSIGIVNIGHVSIESNTHKQNLDSCAVLLGNKIILSNQDICNQDFMNSCLIDIHKSEASGDCQDISDNCEDNLCERKFNISSTYSILEGQETTNSVNIKFTEERAEASRINPAIMFALDFSGSMQGNRINQLKKTIEDFIDFNYDINYGIIIYDDRVREVSEIGKGQAHDNNVLRILNRNSANNGTNFVLPVNTAVDSLLNFSAEAYYIILVSDGKPNENQSLVINLVEQRIRSIHADKCLFVNGESGCISLYTLGVDNADEQLLRRISGNAISQDPLEFSYMVNANQTEAAFNSILEEIICRVGPVETNNQKVYVFHEDFPIIEGEDFVFDYDTKIIKFYDFQGRQVCTDIIDGRNNIIIRWGQPKLEILE
jgi:uncharacterized protein YegL